MSVFVKSLDIPTRKMLISNDATAESLSLRSCTVHNSLYLDLTLVALYTGLSFGRAPLAVSFCSPLVPSFFSPLASSVSVAVLELPNLPLVAAFLMGSGGDCDSSVVSCPGLSLQYSKLRYAHGTSEYVRNVLGKREELTV